MILPELWIATALLPLDPTSTPRRTSKLLYQISSGIRGAHILAHFYQSSLRARNRCIVPFMVNEEY
jgi:hypothetical protein